MTTQSEHDLAVQALSLREKLSRCHRCAERRPLTPERIAEIFEFTGIPHDPMQALLVSIVRTVETEHGIVGQGGVSHG